MEELDLELEFVSGRIFDLTIPKERKYLYKYFASDAQQHFVKYYLTFGNFTRFAEHTGFRFEKRWLRYLKGRLLKLMEAHKKAKEDLDFETLTKIESGQYNL